MKDTLIGAVIVVLLVAALWYAQDTMVVEIDGYGGAIATPVGGGYSTSFQVYR